MPLDFNIKIAGQAGSGIQTIGYILSKVFSRGGYYVFSNQDYQSRIRGGHNFFQIRISTHPVFAHTKQINLLIALDKLSITEHINELENKSDIIYDSEKIPSTEEGDNAIKIPLSKLAVEAGGNKIFTNSVACGATLALLNYGFKPLEELLYDAFSQKKPEALSNNIKAAQLGYQYAMDKYSAGFFHRFTPREKANKMLLNGNEAIALGALGAGCNFFCAYPMSPATSIMVYLAEQQQQFNLMVEQAEDEISALNMVLGASYAGARAMTATSGGGFALMTETLSLAGITETPAVIAIAQRPGPATGLPTRTGQGDLLFALHAGHGEFQRAIFTPGSVQEAFYLTAKAFNIADKYQIPVIILTDQHLADSYININPYNTDNITIERGLSDPACWENRKDDYLRYDFTNSGISPRLIPCKGKYLVVADSDEHTPDGHLTEDLDIRIKMVDKRGRKYKGLCSEIEPPVLHGRPDAELLLVGWGSTYGAIKEAAEILKKQGIGVSQLHFPQLWPFPKNRAEEIFAQSRKKIIIENNSAGQLGWLLRAQTGLAADESILKYDGRPFSAEYIIDLMRK